MGDAESSYCGVCRRPAALEGADFLPNTELIYCRRRRCLRQKLLDEQLDLDRNGIDQLHLQRGFCRLRYPGGLLCERKQLRSGFCINHLGLRCAFQDCRSQVVNRCSGAGGSCGIAVCGESSHRLCPMHEIQPAASQPCSPKRPRERTEEWLERPRRRLTAEQPADLRDAAAPRQITATVFRPIIPEAEKQTG